MYNIHIKRNIAFLVNGKYCYFIMHSSIRAVINCLLDAIEGVSDSVTLLRNCGLTLFNFSIPEDFQFQFERVVKNLVKLALTEDREGLLQRVYVHMCNSIVCHVEGRQKLQVGKLGIITVSVSGNLREYTLNSSMNNK